MNPSLTPINVISLGGGRQSSYMLIKALEGAFEFKPDFAVFADTQSEPKYVISQIQRLSKFVWSRYNFKIHIISSGNLMQDTLDYCSGKNKNGVSLPLFSGKSGAPLNRQCTDYYKIRAVRRCIRSLVGKVPIRLWIGISLDEIERMKVSQVKYIVNYYPLVLSRVKIDQIVHYFSDTVNMSFSKSSCKICPFHSDAYWQRFKIVFPEEFEECCSFDDSVRMLPNAEYPTYIHKSCTPLRLVDFSFKASLFPELIEECTGMCGL